MSEPVELTKIRIVQEEPPNRKAYIAGFESEPLVFGVHGGVKQFYGYSSDVEHPSTLDHVVAAAGG